MGVAPRAAAGGDEEPAERLLGCDPPALQLGHDDGRGALRLDAVGGSEQVGERLAVPLPGSKRPTGSPAASSSTRTLARAGSATTGIGP